MADALKILFDILDMLELADFKKFKTFLSRPLEAFSVIPKGKLQDADVCDTAELMISTHTEEGSLAITKHILEILGQNDLVQKLQQKMQKKGSEVPQPPAPKQDAGTQPSTQRQDVGAHGNPKSKSELQQYTCTLTFNPNTAQKNLTLSDKNKMATYGWGENPYPDHPERFRGSNSQVMCNEGLSGRCYWEVKWRDSAFIGVAYKGMGRAADCVLGTNGKSWSLTCHNKGYTAWHCNEPTDIPMTSPTSTTLGVFLDWEAGFLTVYCVQTP